MNTYIVHTDVGFYSEGHHGVRVDEPYRKATRLSKDQAIAVAVGLIEDRTLGLHSAVVHEEHDLVDSVYRVTQIRKAA